MVKLSNKNKVRVKAKKNLSGPVIQVPQHKTLLFEGDDGRKTPIKKIN